MSSEPARSLQEVVGANVRRIREEGGLTLDEVARVARQCGLKWSTARVGELQAGKLAVSAALLVTIAHVMATVTRKRVTVSELLSSEAPVELTSELTVSAKALQRIFGGGDAPFRSAEVEGGRETIGAGAAALISAAGRITAAGGDFDVTLVTAGIADERAAARIGLTLQDFLSHAHALWGRSLTAERDRRTGSGSAQRRGHVTRQLEAEIAIAIGGRS